MLAVRRVYNILSIEFFVHLAANSTAMTDSDLVLVSSRRSISFTELACKHRVGPSVIVLKTDRRSVQEVSWNSQEKSKMAV